MQVLCWPSVLEWWLPAVVAQLLWKLCLPLCEPSTLMSLSCAAASVEEAEHFRGCLQPLQEVGLVQELLEACRLLGILRQDRCCLAASCKPADTSITVTGVQLSHPPISPESNAQPCWDSECMYKYVAGKWVLQQK